MWNLDVEQLLSSNSQLIHSRFWSSCLSAFLQSIKTSIISMTFSRFLYWSRLYQLPCYSILLPEIIAEWRNFPFHWQFTNLLSSHPRNTSQCYYLWYPSKFCLILAYFPQVLKYRPQDCPLTAKNSKTSPTKYLGSPIFCFQLCYRL